MSDTNVQVLADALRGVIDPELGYNIVDIGLVYEIELEDGRARILLTTTTPGCPATDYIRQAVKDCAAAVPGIVSVEIAMTWLPPWSPDRMSDEAKAHFGGRLKHRRVARMIEMQTETGNLRRLNCLLLRAVKSAR
jgi:metal-sulfur cluster biosynthetic enzyme